MVCGRIRVQKEIDCSLFLTRNLHRYSRFLRVAGTPLATLFISEKEFNKRCVHSGTTVFRQPVALAFDPGRLVIVARKSLPSLAKNGQAWPAVGHLTLHGGGFAGILPFPDGPDVYFYASKRRVYVRFHKPRHWTA